MTTPLIAAGIGLGGLYLATRGSKTTVLPPPAPITGTELTTYVQSLIDQLKSEGWTGNVLPGNTAEEAHAEYVKIHRSLELDRIRNRFMDDLRARGWTGSTLPGNTAEEISLSYHRAVRSYDLQTLGWTGTLLPGNTQSEIDAAYEREYAILTAPVIVPPTPGPDPAALATYRAERIAELQRFGWMGSHLAGNTYAEIDANFDRELATVVTVTPGPASAKFQVGAYVKAASDFPAIVPDRFGTIKSVEWASGLDTYLYVLREYPNSNYPESRISIATPGHTDTPNALYPVGTTVRTPSGRIGTIATAHWEPSIKIWFYTLAGHPFTEYQESLLTRSQ